MPISATLKRIAQPQHRPFLVLSLAMLVQAAVVFCYAMTRITTLRSAAVDIGLYQQLMESILATGKPLATLHMIGSEIHWFGFHFSPILYAVAPIYALHPALSTLVALHAVLIAGAAMFIFFAARQLGLSRHHASIAALVYLFNPFTLNAGVWGFQEPSLAVMWMAISLWSLAARNIFWLCIGALLLLLTKEHYGLSVIALGVMWWWRYQDRRGLAIAAFGAFAFIAILTLIMPYFSGNQLHPMFANGSASDRYSWLLSYEGWKNMLPNILRSDVKYIFLLLLCVCFLPLAGMFWLLAAFADLAVILASSHVLFRSIFNCYSLAIIPVLVMAACAGYLYLKPRLHSRTLWNAAAGILIVYYAHFAALPLPFAQNPYELQVRPQFTLSEQNKKAVADIHALIPQTANVNIQDNVALFFSEYPARFIFPQNLGNADAVILWIEAPRPHNLIHNDLKALKSYFDITHQLFEHKKIKIIYWNKPWIVFAFEGKEVPGARAEALKTLHALAQRQSDMSHIIYGILD